MPHLNRVVQLHNLGQKHLNRFQIKLSKPTHLPDPTKQLTVIYYRSLYTWEQVLDNVLEQGEVIPKKLGNIDISKGSK